MHYTFLRGVNSKVTSTKHKKDNKLQKHIKGKHNPLQVEKSNMNADQTLDALNATVQE